MYFFLSFSVHGGGGGFDVRSKSDGRRRHRMDRVLGLLNLFDLLYIIVENLPNVRHVFILELVLAIVNVRLEMY